MTATRLFSVDRTPAERRAARSSARRSQGSLFDEPTAAPRPICAVCGSVEHVTIRCRQGWAPSIFDAEPAAPVYEYATAAECVADNTSGGQASVSRTLVLTGSTSCPYCPGDLLDELHWTDCDIAGKIVPFVEPDMFQSAYLAAMGPRRPMVGERHARRLAAGLTPCSCQQDHRGDCSNPHNVELTGQAQLIAD